MVYEQTEFKERNDKTKRDEIKDELVLQGMPQAEAAEIE